MKQLNNDKSVFDKLDHKHRTKSEIVLLKLLAKQKIKRCNTFDEIRLNTYNQNDKYNSRKKIEKETKKKQQQRRGFVCVFFSFVWWCFVITFVSRLASLAQSSLGPAYYHR